MMCVLRRPFVHFYIFSLFDIDPTRRAPEWTYVRVFYSVFSKCSTHTHER